MHTVIVMNITKIGRVLLWKLRAVINVPQDFGAHIPLLDISALFLLVGIFILRWLDSLGPSLVSVLAMCLGVLGLRKS
jgi:hypothetical protein